MLNIHPEFAYQSRELGIQIEDTLGEPPDRKNYVLVVESLLAEYTKGTEIDDVNLLSFALFEHLSFDDPAGLLAQSKQYDGGDAVKVKAMVSCADAAASTALAAVFGNNPQLARKAVITAFLFKNTKRWSDEDHSLDALEEEEDKDEAVDEDAPLNAPEQEVIDLFDTREDRND